VFSSGTVAWALIACENHYVSQTNTEETRSIFLCSFFVRWSVERGRNGENVLLRKWVGEFIMNYMNLNFHERNGD